MINTPKSNAEKKKRLKMNVARSGYPHREIEKVEMAKNDINAITRNDTPISSVSSC